VSATSTRVGDFGFTSFSSGLSVTTTPVGW
jgi:hypothetical protein